jgi:hypothetical protein
MLLLNKIDQLLAPSFDHHFAAGTHDVFNEITRSHLVEMLREDGRRELCCHVVAAVALSLHE